jgi:hypothetical protein
MARVANFGIYEIWLGHGCHHLTPPPSVVGPPCTTPPHQLRRQPLLCPWYTRGIGTRSARTQAHR